MISKRTFTKQIVKMPSGSWRWSIQDYFGNYVASGMEKGLESAQRSARATEKREFDRYKDLSKMTSIRARSIQPSQSIRGNGRPPRGR